MGVAAWRRAWDVPTAVAPNKEEHMRRFTLFVGVVLVLLLAVVSPAAAHHLIVSPPGQDEPKAPHWVAGPPGMALPSAAQGQGLHETPFGALFPAAHSAGPNDDKGLVAACEATRENPSAVTFVAPPFGSCEHGVMP
jgi:hypothetical protein